MKQLLQQSAAGATKVTAAFLGGWRFYFDNCQLLMELPDGSWEIRPGVPVPCPNATTLDVTLAGSISRAIARWHWDQGQEYCPSLFWRSHQEWGLDFLDFTDRVLEVPAGRAIVVRYGAHDSDSTRKWTVAASPGGEFSQPAIDEALRCAMRESIHLPPGRMLVEVARCPREQFDWVTPWPRGAGRVGVNIGRKGDRIVATFDNRPSPFIRDALKGKMCQCYNTGGLAYWKTYSHEAWTAVHCLLSKTHTL